MFLSKEVAESIFKIQTQECRARVDILVLLLNPSSYHQSCMNFKPLGKLCIWDTVKSDNPGISEQHITTHLKYFI